MKFFFDNNLPPALARAINALLQVEKQHIAFHLRDKFSPDTKDVEWLTALAGDPEIVVISGDIRISKSPHERQAWLNAKVTVFFLAKGWVNLDLWTQASKLFRWWPVIADQARKIAPGAGFMVPIQFGKGRLKQVR